MKSNPLASNNIAHTHLVSPALASTASGASNLDSSTEASLNREQAQATLEKAFALSGPVVVEVDMNAWGPFAVKFAGPPKKKD